MSNDAFKPTDNEIARTDAIHSELDRAVERNSWRGLRLHLTVSNTHLVFTPAEVRTWLSVKRALLEQLSSRESAVYAEPYCGDEGKMSASVCAYDDDCGAPNERNLARGLVMYRQSAAFIEATRDPETMAMCSRCGTRYAEPCDALCGACQQANGGPTRADAERTGPINGGSDLSHELMIFERQKAEDEASGRRARLVAALSAELSRPVEPRFPPEGRSDRVFGGRRW